MTESQITNFLLVLVGIVFYMCMTCLLSPPVRDSLSRREAAVLSLLAGIFVSVHFALTVVIFLR